MTGLLLALQPESAADSAVKLCGGRSVTVPLLGTYTFRVTAVYQDEKFGFRCVRPRHSRQSHPLFTHCLRRVPVDWLSRLGIPQRVRAQDGDLHVANCFGNRVAPATGQILQAAPCLTQLLEKYSLTDFAMDVSSMPDKVRLSATASPMGYAFGTMGLELSQAACPKDEL